GPAGRLPAQTTVPLPLSSTTVSPSAPAPPTPGLQAALITPTDLGGYFSVTADGASRLVGGSACLQPLGGSGATSAGTFLTGPTSTRVPMIGELLSGYPGAGADGAYNRAVGALSHCPTATATVNGSRVSARLAPYGGINPLGDRSAAFQGSFTLPGLQGTITAVVVETGQVLASVVYVDRAPPSSEVYGTLPTTVVAVIGKTAGIAP
ncbi:MAG: hypothetical protein ACRDZY_16760, partial [Acidimicrobiales bacterium]